MKRSALFSIILFQFLFAWGLPFGNAAECPRYLLSTWRLNLTQSTLQWISPPKAAADAEKFCEALPDSGQNNVQLEIFSNGKPLFSRKLFVPRQQFFDFTGKANEMDGGWVEDPDLFFSTLIPAKVLGKAELNFRLTDLKDGKVLGKGKYGAGDE
ncbi:MAG TPA: hypothetical protein DCS07_11660 [Bdellovibrionales bacterium]|nr:MAG: hypothetical protein A2X97_02935 [Bdellovibrionales bacterium GWA1_52_35]OFZ39959.1 MAG: hypothetical protein A2070_07910 [Bdellovibrionales bacterium GWC1_52_8]HAR43264.1 hypothetical protein [Bdellovibrionales bacterium]HCM40148.1 hypothetical protein [Bdellovibrionales bacterium]